MEEKKTAGLKAAEYIEDGMVLGLGMDIGYVSEQLNSVPGILETGLFINLCNKIIVGTADGVRVIENHNKKSAFNGKIMNS